MEKKLYKKKDGAMVSGVLNGLSEYLGMDVTLVRVVFAVLAVCSSGIPFILIYIIMAMVMPEKNDLGFEDYEVE